MSGDVVQVHKFRTRVPKEHQVSIDTRLAWLWNQRFGTVQQVWNESKDALDHTAATLILQAIFGKDLDSIILILQRLEGSPVYDDDLQEPVARV